MAKRIIIMTDIRKPNSATTHSQMIVKEARGVFRVLLSIEKQVTAIVLAIAMVLVNAHAFIAFEAHVVDVKAEVAKIDAPLVAPAGGSYAGPVDITIDALDTDATHVFYTITLGTTDPNVADDPVCGDVLGGAKPQGPITISEDTVVKAIACNGDDAGASGSIITAEAYDFPQEHGVIRGFKYNDVDKSGTLTPGDFPVGGWYIQAATTTFATTTVTNAHGFFSFTGLLPDTYSVEEETREGWETITPSIQIVVLAGSATEEVDFFNYDTGYSCFPKDVSFPAGLAVQAAGLITENNDDIALGAGVTINGDARSNDDIERIGTPTDVVINGSATSTDQVDNGIFVSEDVLEGAPTAALPDVMISEWQARAADGGIVNGDFSFPNNTVGLLLGPSEITGNVKFGNNNAAVIRGPLYIHGNLTIGGSTMITQDAGFGNQFVPIIVDGTIDIATGANFVGSGSTGAVLLVSTKSAVALTDAAIEVASNASDLGDVVLYASNGDVYVRSGRTILAAFAAHGTGSDSDSNAAVRLDNNVTVNYRALPDKISCGPRQPYESTAHVLINEFMPNPFASGTDQGTAGAPLDGEWVELFNPTSSDIDVAGYALFDSVNTHEVVVSSANTNTGGTVIPSSGYLVVYRDGDSDFELNNAGGDTVRLFTDLISNGGALVDSHTYTVAAPDDKSFARVPDGAANWIDPDATPGEPNTAFVSVNGSNEPVQFPSRPMFRSDGPRFTIVVLPPPSPVEPPPNDEQITTDEKAKPEEPAIANVEAPQTDSTGPDGDTPPQDENATSTPEVINSESPTPSVGQEEQDAPPVASVIDALVSPEPTPEAPMPPAEIIESAPEETPPPPEPVVTLPEPEVAPENPAVTSE